jgi:inhibitor of KinA
MCIRDSYQGPDLADAARLLGLSIEELIRQHTAQPWRVLMIGFAPGFPYIGPLPATLTLPRRATPRPAVPAGSVALAAGFTGIYPACLPGGWHLIGQTNVVLFDPHRTPPALLQPGDRVQFVACCA